MPVDRAVRTLSPQALAGLRAAFSAEVAQRLPRLEAVSADSSPDRLAEALRDAHNLGSSAAVVGQREASRTARAIEAALDAGQVAGVGAQVARLTELLRDWR